MSFLISFALIQICISTPIHPEERIVNGIPIWADSVPWQASMRRGYDFGYNITFQQAFCGGALIEINPPIILTAAHCVDMYYQNDTDGTIRQLDNATSGANTILSNLNIDLNRTFANRDIDSFTTLEITDINFIHIHENWDTDNIASGNDIALIIFSTHNNTINPMPNISIPILPMTLDTCCDENQQFYATGYGANASDGGPTDTLEYTILKYINKPECEALNAAYHKWHEHALYMAYNITNNLTENFMEILNETFISAKTDAIINPQLSSICADGNGTDTCQGDSGGPLWRINNQSGDAEIIGVVSYGLGCSIDDPFSVPAYYTNVAYYYQWIEKIITYVLFQETFGPTEMPTEIPTTNPTVIPSEIPTEIPTTNPTVIPTEIPTEIPSEMTAAPGMDTSTTELVGETETSMFDRGIGTRICYGLMVVVSVIFAAYNI